MKSERNEAERGLPFSRVNDFDWLAVLMLEDDRKDYGKLRLLIFGMIDDRLHAAVLTPRADGLRVISLRRANRRQVRLMSEKSDEVAERPDQDNPEWTRAMFRKARPASEMLPGIIGEKAAADLIKRGRGRPPSDDKRVVRTFRLPADVVEAYEATGTDWRQLVARTLRDHMPG